MGFPGGSDGKASACNVGDPGSIPGSGRSPGEGNGNPLQHSCLEKSHGRRSLIGYSLWGRKQSQMTERLHFHFLSCFDRSLVAIKIHTRRVIFASKLMSVLSTWTIKLLTKCGRQNNGSLNMSLSKFLKMVKMLSYMAKGTIQVPRM